MIRKFIISRFHFSSVISDDLLISISMGSHESFKTQQQLADHFLSQQIITSPQLHKSFSRLDRAFYATDASNPLYGNFPIKLNPVSNMTTPIMHAIPAEDIVKNIIPHLPQINFIDIGTGRGYMAQLITLCLQQLKSQYSVSGIDIDNKLIEEAKAIQDKIQPELKFDRLVYFNNKDFHETIEQQEFNVMNFGFAVQHQDIQNLKSMIKTPIWYAVCPLQEQNSQEQWLTRVKCENGELQFIKLMKCVFQYSLKEVESTLQTLQRLQRDEALIESWVKEWNKTQNLGKKLSLNNMQQNTQLMQQLSDLRIIKKKISFLKRQLVQ